MKLRILYFKQILLAAFIISWYQCEVFSQAADSSAIKKPGMFVGFSLGPSQSQIVNTGTLSVSELLSGKKSSFFGSVDIGYFFSRYFGLSSGIGFNSYKSLLSLKTYQNKVNAVDSENEAYELRVSGSDIKETQKVAFLTIPILINLRLPLSKMIGFFLQPGVNLAVPLSKNYQSSGTFTYQGFYPAYNVVLQNLPDYGFPSDLKSESDGVLEMKPVSFSAIVSAGFDFLIQNKLQFGIAACYDKSLSGISQYPSPADFQLSSEVSKINSFMGGSSKVTSQSMGIKIVFRYYFN